MADSPKGSTKISRRALLRTGAAAAVVSAGGAAFGGVALAGRSQRVTIGTVTGVADSRLLVKVTKPAHGFPAGAGDTVDADFTVHARRTPATVGSMVGVTLVEGTLTAEPIYKTKHGRLSGVDGSVATVGAERYGTDPIATFWLPAGEDYSRVDDWTPLIGKNVAAQHTTHRGPGGVSFVTVAWALR